MIHILCVPILVFTAQVMLATIPLPAAAMDLRSQLASALPLQVAPHVAQAGWEGIMYVIYLTYYFTLEPVAAVCSFVLLIN